MQSTQEQKNKFEKWNRIIKGGPYAILQYIDDLEQKIQALNPDFKKFLEAVKGKDSDPKEVSIILKNDPFFLKATKPKYKEDFALEDRDITDIAMLAAEKMIPSLVDYEELAKMTAPLVEVPIVEKVIEHHHHTKTIENTPIVTNNIVEKAVGDTPQEIKNKLESLAEGERVNIKYIDGVIDFFEELIKKHMSKFNKSKNGSTVFVGGGTNGGRIVKYHDLSDQLNGVLKTFALPANWRVISVQSSSFPSILRPTIDYVNDQQSITFTSEIDAASTLATGQTLIVLYSE